jgi:hypothetical protein
MNGARAVMCVEWSRGSCLVCSYGEGGNVEWGHWKLRAQRCMLPGTIVSCLIGVLLGKDARLQDVMVETAVSNGSQTP